MKTNKSTRRQRPLVPSFDSGVLAEPAIAFGGQHTHVDPKTGLALYGPYTPIGQTRPTLSSIVVGVVGPASMLPDASRWLHHCSGQVTNDGKEPFLYPGFPGFNSSPPFQCELVHGDAWRHSFAPGAMDAALSETNYLQRVQHTAQLYVRSVETLAQRDQRPDVVLCCIPQDVIDLCTVRPIGAGKVQRRKVSKSERIALAAARAGQTFLFPNMDPTLGVEEPDNVHENLRRAIKAETMQFGIPTQLVWPRSLTLTDVPQSPGQRSVQDAATRAWNFTTALFHKAGATPWRLAEIEPGACYVGISFYRELGEASPRLRTSMAQAFTAAGDGYVLRGRTIEWDRRSPSPHLDASSAAALVRDVLELYRQQHNGSLPSRLVVHKTSRYWEEELAGFREATRIVPRSDFVAFGQRRIQFYRASGQYPALRGTYVRFSPTNLLLYTAGFVPFLRTYPGSRVPQPIEVLEHHGSTPWDTILREILALTKMNWNTADFAGADPITTAFARRVGSVLAELPSGLPMRHEYRFYM